MVGFHLSSKAQQERMDGVIFLHRFASLFNSCPFFTSLSWRYCCYPALIIPAPSPFLFLEALIFF